MYDLGKTHPCGGDFCTAAVCGDVLLPPVALGVVTAFISAVACFELLRATGEGNVTRIMQVVSIVSAAVLFPLGAWLGYTTLTMGACTFVVMAVSFLVCHPRL